MWSRLLAVVACAASLLTAPAAGVTQSITVDGRELPVTSVDVRGTRSLGGNDRGPALAVLADGTLLLGGGPRGGGIWAWTDDSTAPLLLGNVMTTKERLRDSRFAITDIAVLAQSQDTAELLVSFPRVTAIRRASSAHVTGCSSPPSTDHRVATRST